MTLSVPAELQRFRDYVSRLDYRKRRMYLWHETRPRQSRFLYKFRSLVPTDEASVDRIRDVLIHSRFWLSSPLDFNDPFDMCAKFVAEGTAAEKRDRIRAILKEQNIKYSELRKRLPELVATPNSLFATLAQNEHLESLMGAGVYSFGGDPRSILMWSHYASNHEGICLQFETARDVLTFTQTVKIEYTDDYPIVNWIRKFDGGIERVISTKFRSWSYERETRLLVLDAAHTYFCWRPDALQGVIIGCRASDNTNQKLKQLLSERASAGLPMPRLYRAVQHDSKYKLIVKRE